MIGLNNQIIFFDKNTNTFVYENYNDFNRTILRPIRNLYLSQKNKKFNFVEWFHSPFNPRYRTICDFRRPKIFIENDKRYINLAGYHLHINKKFKPLNNYSKVIQDKVKFIWHHIKKIWCSNNHDQYKYIKNWIANVVVGNKMKTCIYLQSQHGIGKSIINDLFLSKYVIGNELSFTYSEVSSFLKFNRPLMGRLLIVFEEVPSADQYEWRLFSERLKHWLTEANTIDIENKGKDKITVPNTVSFMINTNNYQAIKLLPDDRRFFIPDIVCKKESKDYYKLLYQYVTDPIVREAFFMNCREIVDNNPQFDEFDRPVTNKFISSMVDSLPSTYQFIKEMFILNNVGINMKFKDLYTDYIEYCMHQSKRPLNKQAFKDELLNIGINFMHYSKKTS